jgi:hypothetical protein
MGQMHMTPQEWFAWRSLERGDLAPTAELLIQSDRPLHPQLRQSLARMILHDPSSDYWLDTRLRNGLAPIASHKQVVDRASQYMSFAISVIGHGGLRRTNLANAIVEAMKEHTHIKNELTARTHWKKGKKDALAWLDFVEKFEDEAP